MESIYHMHAYVQMDKIAILFAGEFNLMLHF